MGGKPRVHVGMVDERVEGLPVGQCEISCRRGGGVLRAALRAPAQLLGVRQGGEVVESHHLSRKGELSLRGCRRNQSPDTCGAV
jgi:hypothetical protein